MIHRYGTSGLHAAAAFLAVAALVLSVLHGAVPHYRSQGPCHDCETLASPALPQPAGVSIRPDLSPDVLPACAQTRPAEGPARRLRSTRAPPSPDAA